MRKEILIFVFLWAGINADGFTVNIEGEDVNPDVPGEGDLENADRYGGKRVADKEARKAAIPFLCATTGKTCGASNLVKKTFDLWKPNSAIFPMDCLRACRNPCLGTKIEFKCAETCVGAEVVNGECLLALAPKTCSKAAASDPASVMYTPAAPGADPNDPASCPGGVPAPGFPEDDVSKTYCKADGKECSDGKQVDKEVYFEASERLCRATCNTRTYCTSFYYSPVRRCHMRETKCERNGDGTLKLQDAPGGSYLIRLSNAEKKNGCPPGTAVYVPPEEKYYDEFCAYPGKKCDIGSTADQSGDMYYQDDSPERGFRKNVVDDCKNKCSGIFGCGSVWSYPDPMYSDKVRCVFQRIPERCPKDKIVDNGGDNSHKLFMRIGISDATQEELNDPAQRATICGRISGSTTPWKEAYCGFLGMTCSTATVLAEVDTSDVKACLTACKKFTQGNCKGVAINANCKLLDSSCYETADGGKSVMTKEAGTTYLRQKEAQDGPCPFPEDACAKLWNHARVDKTKPATGLTCEQANGEAGDTSGCTRSCKSPSGEGCSAASDGCKCKGNYLFSDSWGRCVPPNVCRCYHSATPSFSRVTESIWLNSDCKQSYRCENALDLGDAPSVIDHISGENGDTLCVKTRHCHDVNGEGFCACPLGHRLGNDGECIAMS